MNVKNKKIIGEIPQAKKFGKKLDLQVANLEGILLRLKVFDTQEIVLKMGQSTGAQIGQAIVQSRLQVIEACL